MIIDLILIVVMGFEEEVPPVPDRLAEIKMMDRL